MVNPHSDNKNSIATELTGRTSADIYTPRKRSQVMAEVRRDETRPERIVRRHLFSEGFRFRKNDPRYPGRPDIVLAKYRTIIFVHGCFWHGHPGCKKSKLPATRRDFWRTKINNTRQRDLSIIASFESSGWHVIIVWECELGKRNERETRLERLVDEIRFGESNAQPIQDE